MKIAVYTSCALNYYAKARVLADSIRRNSHNTTVTLCLCDALDADSDPLKQGFDRFWTPEDLGYDRGWIFKHNVMELCTGVKGRALTRLMEVEEADLYVYLDPDVYVYDDLSWVLDAMGDASIGLVPHILSPEETEIGVRMTEMSVTEHGIYNLGHLFVRPDANGRKLAAWWRARLDAYCYDDKAIGLFTDQRWMDLAPAIFDGVRILRTPNLDVASWNLFGRVVASEIQGDETRFTVDGLPLITYHFSGTGPGGVHRRVREIFDPCNGAMAEIERRYEDQIAARGQKHLERIPPAHDVFDNGQKIPAEARKLYRIHADLQQAFPDPYATDGDATYLNWLRENKPGLTAGVAIPPYMLERAFHDLFDADYYLSRYPDARLAVDAGETASAVDHYIEIGSALLYDPNPFFVSRYYYDQAKYLDGFTFRALPRSPRSTVLWHYLETGLANGVEPIEYFDSAFYCRENPDIATAYRTGRISSPLHHFCFAGSAENRRPGPDLHPEQILEADPYIQKIIKEESLRGVFDALVRLGRIQGREAVGPA